MDGVQSGKVNIATIHGIHGAWLQRKDIQDVDVVGDDDQRALIRHPRQLRAVDAAQQARQAFETRDDDAMAEGHGAFLLDQERPNIFTASVGNVMPGQKVTIEGFALNDRAAFGDSTVHVSEGATAIRATNVFRANVRQGDSVRLTGRTGIVDGQPVIDRVTSQILATTGTPTPAIVTTAQLVVASSR